MLKTYYSTTVGKEIEATNHRSKSPSMRPKKKEKRLDKKAFRSEQMLGEGEDLVFENTSLLNHHSKTSVNNINERIRSAESLLFENEPADHGFKGNWQRLC